MSSPLFSFLFFFSFSLFSHQTKCNSLARDGWCTSLLLLRKTKVLWFAEFVLNENSVSPSVGRAVKYYHSSRKINQQTVLPVMYPVGSEWCFAQDLCQYWWQQQQHVMKWVMDTLLELANQETFWISTNAMCNRVRFRYACFSHDRLGAVSDSCESQLGLRGDPQEGSIDLTISQSNVISGVYVRYQYWQNPVL